MQLQKARRYRGVVLTTAGWDKVQAAKTQAEFNEKAGNRFTLEELNERMSLSLNTISKVLGRSEPVDKQSLQWAFRAFGLELSKHDYTRPSDIIERTAALSRQSHPNRIGRVPLTLLYSVGAVKNWCASSNGCWKNAVALSWCWELVGLAKPPWPLS